MIFLSFTKGLVAKLENKLSFVSSNRGQGGSGSSGGSGGGGQQQSTQPYPGSTLNVHPFLSSMVIYTQPMKFQGFDYAEEENLACKMSSFPEMTAYGESFNVEKWLLLANF